MKRRKQNSSEESLDLLLDTITNTFGGLIFIAILIALLVGNRQPNASKTKAESEDDAQLESKMTKLKKLKSELDLLSQQAASRNKFVGQLSTPEQKNLVNELTNIKAIVRGLQANNHQLSSDNTNLEAANAGKRKNIDEIEGKHNSLQGQATDLAGKLSVEKSKRTTVIDSPRAVVTSRKPIAFIVRYDRIYHLEDHLKQVLVKDGPRFESTTQDQCELIFSGKFFRLKKTGGYPATAIDQLNRFLKRVNPTKNDINVCIYEDSFDKFKGIRDSLRANKLKFGLLLLAPNEPPLTLGPGNSKQKVQ